MSYILYTDGACSPNPGKGGYGGVILFEDKVIRKFSGGEEQTTNNRMEVKAIVRGLSKIPRGSKVHVITDSMYAVKCFKWEWTRKSNTDLWLAIEKQIPKFKRISIEWVRGHNGNRYNEMADRLARKGRGV